jgi:hypothetical protein
MATNRERTAGDALNAVKLSKDMLIYATGVVGKSPKWARHGLGIPLLNACRETALNLFRANQIWIGPGATAENFLQRAALQREAMVRAKEVGLIASVMFESTGQLLAKKHFETLAQQTTSLQNITGAWMKSERARSAKANG